MEEIIKSYTDLEQSRQLKDIISTSKADMIWVLANPDLPMIKAISWKDSYRSKYYETIPAWSLTALLCVLSGATLDISKDTYFRIYYNKMFSDWYNNPIDACVEIILRLCKKIN